MDCLFYMKKVEEFEAGSRLSPKVGICACIVSVVSELAECFASVERISPRFLLLQEC